MDFDFTTDSIKKALTAIKSGILMLFFYKILLLYKIARGRDTRVCYIRLANVVRRGQNCFA